MYVVCYLYIELVSFPSKLCWNKISVSVSLPRNLQTVVCFFSLWSHHYEENKLVVVVMNKMAVEAFDH